MNLLFVRHLTVIDFAYLDPRRGFVGESWIVDVELEGDLDEQGMVFDFSHVKKALKAGIDDFLDHKLAVPTQLPGLVVEPMGETVQIRLPLATGGEIVHQSPASALCLISTAAVTPESVVPVLTETLRRRLPDNVKRLGIVLRQEAIEGAFYHYVHGLKKHQGHCQRIAHGHRSRLEISQDGSRSATLEQAWAANWCDIYIGTREDLVGAQEIDGISHTEFAYDANQGHFYLCLPSRQVYLIDTDSTVEWIAQHIVHSLKQTSPGSTFEVRAFEGVDKGSLARL